MSEPSNFETSVFNTLGFDELRLKGSRIVSAFEYDIRTMKSAALNEACRGKSIHTPKQCQRMMLKQLRTLNARLNRTNNEAADGTAFCEDISILLLNLHDLIAAGVGNSHDVVFQKWQPHQFNVYQLVERIIDLKDESTLIS